MLKALKLTNIFWKKRFLKFLGQTWPEMGLKWSFSSFSTFMIYARIKARINSKSFSGKLKIYPCNFPTFCIELKPWSQRVGGELVINDFNVLFWKNFVLGFSRNWFIEFFWFYAWRCKSAKAENWVKFFFLSFWGERALKLGQEWGFL